MVHCTIYMTTVENKACHTLQYHDLKINVMFTCSKCTMTCRDNYRVVSKTYSSTPCVRLFYKPYLSMCCHQVLLQSQTAYWHSWRRLVSWRPPSWVPLPSSGLRKSRSIRRCWVVTDRRIHRRHTPVDKHNETLHLNDELRNLKLFLSVLKCTHDVSVDDTIWRWARAWRSCQTRATVCPFISWFSNWFSDKGIVTDTRTVANAPRLPLN